MLRDVINSFHPGHATLAMIPAMDHFLTQAPSMKKSMEEPSGVFEPKVLQAVQDWLTKQSAG